MCTYRDKAMDRTGELPPDFRTAVEIEWSNGKTMDEEISKPLENFSTAEVGPQGGAIHGYVPGASGPQPSWYFPSAMFATLNAPTPKFIIGNVEIGKEGLTVYGQTVTDAGEIYAALTRALNGGIPAARDLGGAAVRGEAPNLTDAELDAMPKRAAFIAWAKDRSLDTTETKDAWGQRAFLHDHIETMWIGWFHAPVSARAADALDSQPTELPLMRAAFTTAESGPDGYHIKFKFPTLTAMQAAHRSWVEADSRAPGAQDSLEARTEDIRLRFANPTSIPRSTLLHYAECLLAHIAVLRAAPTAQQSLTAGGAVPGLSNLKRYMVCTVDYEPEMMDHETGEYFRVSDVQAALAAAPLPQVQSEALGRDAVPEPVAVVEDICRLAWAGTGDIAELMKRHDLKVGSNLYAAPVLPDENLTRRYNWIRIPANHFWLMGRARWSTAAEFDALIDSSIEAIAAAAQQAIKPSVDNDGGVCMVPPPGWACSRAAGHDGPCAASVMNGGE